MTQLDIKYLAYGAIASFLPRSEGPSFSTMMNKPYQIIAGSSSQYILFQQMVVVEDGKIIIADREMPVGFSAEVKFKGDRYLIRKTDEKSISIYQIVD